MASSYTRGFVVVFAAFALATLGVRVGSAAGPAISSIVFSGSVRAPTVTISGHGLGALPTGSQPPTSSSACRAEHAPGDQGDNYGDRLFFLDHSTGLAGGLSGPYGGDPDVVSCVGLIVESFSSTRVVYRLGSDYAKHPYSVSAGDRVLIVVNEARTTITVHYR